MPVWNTHFQFYSTVSGMHPISVTKRATRPRRPSRQLEGPLWSFCYLEYLHKCLNKWGLPCHTLLPTEAPSRSELHTWKSQQLAVEINSLFSSKFCFRKSVPLFKCTNNRGFSHRPRSDEAPGCQTRTSVYNHNPLNRPRPVRPAVDCCKLHRAGPITASGRRTEWWLYSSGTVRFSRSRWSPSSTS